MASTLEALLLAQVNFLLNPPKAAIYTAAPFSAGALAWNPIPLGTVITDPYSGWSSANPTRWTAPVPGWYEPSAVICWSNAQTTGYRLTGVGVNGARTLGSFQDLPAGPDYTTVASKPVQVYLNVGDYVEIIGWTSVASSTAGNATDINTRLDIRWVSQ